MSDSFTPFDDWCILLALGSAQENTTAKYNNLKTDFSMKMLTLAQAREIREVS